MKITDTYLVHPLEVQIFELGCKELGIQFKLLSDSFPYLKYEVTGDSVGTFIALGVTIACEKFKTKL